MASVLAAFGRRCSLCAAARRSSFLELGLNASNFSVRTSTPRLLFLQRTISRMPSIATTNNHCWSRVRSVACSTRPFSSEGTEVVEENASDTDPTSASTVIPEGTVVMLKRFPTLADTSSLAEFFDGLIIAPNGVLFMVNPVSKKRLGSVLVAFASRQDAEQALAYSGKIYRDHNIQVAPCDSKAFTSVLETIKEYKNRDCIALRMTGLPYSFDEDDIVEFLGYAVQVDKDRVDMLYLSDGSFSGDALVQFDSEQDRRRAIGRNEAIINSRAVRLIKITPEEYYMAYSKNKKDLEEFKSCEKNAIKLLSLPFSCSLQELSDFLGEFKDEVAPDGVKMVYNSANRFSGIAYVRLASEEVADAAARTLNNRTLGVRSIGVHKCYMMKEPIQPLPNKSWASRPPIRRSQSTILIRGFPYSTSISELVEFFSDFNVKEDFIEMTYDHLGRPAGSAYITLPSIPEAQRAIRDLNFKYMGTRYVELLQAN